MSVSAERILSPFMRSTRRVVLYVFLFISDFMVLQIACSCVDINKKVLDTIYTY